MTVNSKTNERLWDAIIKEALIESCNREINMLEEQTKPHTFRSEIIKRVRKTINAVGRKAALKTSAVFAKRFAITAAVIMGVVFSGLLTQSEVSAAVGVVIRKVFSDHDNYTFEGKTDSGELDTYKRLGYAPEGYSLFMAYYTSSFASLEYDDLFTEEQIIFDYGFLENTSNSIDNEMRTHSEIFKNGITYNYYKANEEGIFNILFWVEDDYYYMISADVPLEEFMKMAGNITTK